MGDPDALSLWAGQGAPLTRVMPAGDLVRTLVDEMRRMLESAGIAGSGSPSNGIQAGKDQTG